MPGYAAGFDAGYLAGLFAASQGAGSAVAAEGGAAASEASEPPRPPRPPFLALLENFPDLFRQEVLERLDPVDRCLLARTGSAARTAVKLSVLPRVGGSVDEPRFIEPRLGIAPFCQSLSMFQWAVANLNIYWQLTATCARIAEGGHLEVLQWAREHGCPWDERTCGAAAGGGHLEVLIWAREQGCPW
jgi:hypothetical protein